MPPDLRSGRAATKIRRSVAPGEEVSGPPAKGSQSRCRWVISDGGQLVPFGCGFRHHLASARVLRDPRDHRVAALEDGGDDAAHPPGDDRQRGEVGGDVGRRRRRRGGPCGADGGGRVPARSEALRAARREGAEGPAPLRPAGHRQDAAREGGRARVGRALLLRERVVVRRDVRRPRRRAHPQALPRGAQARARDRLHRRARRSRRAAHRPRLQPRAGPDAQPAPRRAGRVRGRRAGRRHGGVQPHPGSRPRAATARALRPADARPAAGPRPAARRSSRVHTRGKPLAADVDLKQVARQTSGLTGAELANICNEAAIFAGRRTDVYVTQRDFDNAIERVVAGLQQKKVLTEKERRILAYHEGGHALMAHLMGTGRRAAEGDDRLPRQRARLRAAPARGGSLPPHEGGAHRLDGRRRSPAVPRRRSCSGASRTAPRTTWRR